MYRHVVLGEGKCVRTAFYHVAVIFLLKIEISGNAVFVYWYCLQLLFWPKKVIKSNLPLRLSFLLRFLFQNMSWGRSSVLPFLKHNHTASWQSVWASSCEVCSSSAVWPSTQPWTPPPPYSVLKIIEFCRNSKKGEINIRCIFVFHSSKSMQGSGLENCHSCWWVKSVLPWNIIHSGGYWVWEVRGHWWR